MKSSPPLPCLLLGLLLGASSLRAEAQADIVVYGGTSGAVVAAIAAHQAGKKVVLLSPDRHLGGLTSNGLGWTDLGNRTVLGGLAREFYHRIWKYYQDPAAWTPDGTINKAHGQYGPAVDDANELMYLFEPKAAEAVFEAWLTENGITVERGRLDLSHGVSKEGTRITAIRTEDGREFRGRVFIDATYEGDLMARAGVSFTAGRESAAQYGESLNGLRVALAVKNQLPPGIDPYVRKGDPASGLLPGVHPLPAVPDGTEDDLVQAYCYRMCLTDDPSNRIPIAQPEGYREEDYELLFRAIEAGQKGGFLTLSPLPNRKTDSNNGGGISLDLIGASQGYPEGDYASRERIALAHEAWQRGLLWTLQNHPRVPAELRARYAKWGLPKDEFQDHRSWPSILYVREARRLVGDYVLTQSTPEKSLPAARPIGLGEYAMDSHNVQRIVGPNGDVRNEGDVQKHPAKPYQIDYGVLLPRKAECENLLVPFCISASHVAFASARMEPIFMMLSHSAALAASLAADKDVAVQDVPYGELREKLLATGQHLSP